MNNTSFAIALCSACLLIGLSRASAQMSSLPAGTIVLPELSFRAPASLPSSSTTGAAVPSLTRLVRIYNGGGHFDPALAEKLRPMLTKALVADSDHKPALPPSTSHEGIAPPPTTVANPMKFTEKGTL